MLLQSRFSQTDRNSRWADKILAHFIYCNKKVFKKILKGEYLLGLYQETGLCLLQAKKTGLGYSGTRIPASQLSKCQVMQLDLGTYILFFAFISKQKLDVLEQNGAIFRLTSVSLRLFTFWIYTTFVLCFFVKRNFFSLKFILFYLQFYNVIDIFWRGT